MCLQNKIVIHDITIDYTESEPFVCESAITCLMLKIKRLNRQVTREKNLGKRTHFLKLLNEYRDQLDLLVEEMRK